MFRRGSLLIAALCALGFTLLTPLTASAAPVPVKAAPATTVPEAHTCQRFGPVVSNYVAAHCADVDVFVNSGGAFAVRGQGQAFCQRDSDDAAVRCAGIVQTITITDLTTGQSAGSGNKTCGAYGGAACPAPGRFQNLSAGIYFDCGHSYRTTVRTKTLLPGSVATARSADWYSLIVTRSC